MIDSEVFVMAMGVVADRCAKPPDDRQLAMYYEFLSPRLSTEEFQEAALAVWSSAEFFPPPVAFLEARIGGEWDRLARLIAEYVPPNVRSGWASDYAELSDETRRTVTRLGGPLAFKERLYDFSVPKAFEKFTVGYRQALQESAAEIASSPDRERLSSGVST